MQEATPEQYNAPLTARGEAWRMLVSVGISALAWSTIAPVQWREARLLFWLDLLLGLVGLVLSAFRRRWPLRVALLIGVFGALSASAAGPGTLVAVSLATRRVLWQIALVGGVGIAASQLFPLLEPSQADPWWLTLAVSTGFTVAMLVWGMYLGSRRELLWTLRDRAERAEAEQELRVSQGRANERARIAREMHDVLAHRITLITMHAGALAYRTDLTAEQIRATAELIQGKSHEALADLRQVLGVLRADPPGDVGDDGEGGERGRPQPTFRDLRALIGEAEESGMHVRYDDEGVLDAQAMPEQVGRTTYRIVQEGLTNARKHAPGAAVVVRVTGSPSDGVEIRISNPARARAAPRLPGSGLGLVGLRERAKLAGGRLDSGSAHGTFELRGWLPWTA